MAGAKPTVVVLGTCDTKLEETMFVRDAIEAGGAVSAMVLDIGSANTVHPAIDVNSPELLCLAGNDGTTSSLSRADFVAMMAAAATHCVREHHAAGHVHGLIAVGGSTGTSLAASVARDALPVGCPKLLVSTMAAGDVSAYVDCVDITLMYSVVDIAGINFLSTQILSNGAAAITGMAAAYYQRQKAETKDKRRRLRVGMTMFGVTTPACDRIREELTVKFGYEVIVFHATGAGGRSFERLAAEGELDAAIDLTTTEIADYVVGGVLSAGPDRLRAAARAGIPQVVSVGACDMVNFGAEDTVPQRWRDEGRTLHVHNSAVTLMRTSPRECEQIGEFIAKALTENARDKSLVKVLFPLRDVSMISGEAGPFHHAEADTRLRESLERGVQAGGIEIVCLDSAINDEAFAMEVVSTLNALILRRG